MGRNGWGVALDRGIVAMWMDWEVGVFRRASVGEVDEYTNPLHMSDTILLIRSYTPRSRTGWHQQTPSTRY